MDKKRRKNTAHKKGLSEKNWLALMSFVNGYKTCGFIYKKFNFLESYGKGVFEYYSFDGLYIGITDLRLVNDFEMYSNNQKNTLELSFLIEGEQIIHVSGIADSFIYESQESYLINTSELKTNTIYHKKKHLREVKIRMRNEFIKKHRLNDAYDILDIYSVTKLKNSFQKPLCVKKQEILSEVLTDNQYGLSKRLFLESKALELLALQLDAKPIRKDTSVTQSDTLLKKVYKTQHIIASDLSTQYSIAELARELGVNDFVLKKEFKRVFNKTIFEYASETRMKKAKQLLKNTQKPIYEIAELIGYKNATHFSAAFKKLENITPKMYRLK